MKAKSDTDAQWPTTSIMGDQQRAFSPSARLQREGSCLCASLCHFHCFSFILHSIKGIRKYRLLLLIVRYINITLLPFVITEQIASL